MATAISFNGVSYSVPSALETNWASLSAYLIALSTGTFQRAGGSFVLTADADFGANFGLKTVYVTSRAASAAAAGVIRLGNAETISWRNAASDADLPLVVNSSNALSYNGNAFLSSAGVLTGNLTGNVTGNLTGNVTGNVSGSSGSTTGNAATATALAADRTIAGVSFNGNTTIDVNAGALTGATLASNVLTSSLTTVGALNAGSITSGFGSIDIGSDALTAGAASFTTLASSGAATLGASTAASTIAHSIYGCASTLAGATPGLTLYANNNASGDVRMEFGLDSTNNIGWLNVTETGVGGAGLKFGSTNAEVGSYTSAGAWTLGATSGSSVNHKVQSGGTTEFQIASAADSNTYLRFLPTGAGRARIFSSNTNGIVFSNSADTLIGEFSDAGAWTLGAAVTNNGNGQAHIFHGGINAGGTGTGANERRLNLNANTYSANSDHRARVSGVAGSMISLYTPSSDTDPCIYFDSNLAADGTTTGSSTKGTMTPQGAWTFSSTGGYHAHNMSAADWTTYATNSHASNAYGKRIRYSACAPNGTGNQFLFCDDNVGTKIELRSNGGLANFSANNVNLSDERVKKDILPAKSYLDTMCAIQVVTFKYKDQTHDDTNLGVIAQQVESVAPEFVDDTWSQPDGTMLKAIYDTDIMFGMLKAIQELSAKIDQSNARISALEAK